MSRLRWLVPVLVVAWWCVPTAAAAQVTCSFTAGPTPILFGAYAATATTPTDSSGTFTYSCSSAKARPVTIQLSAGRSGSFNPRQLGFGAERLDYNLYSDAAMTAIWGEAPGQTVTSVPGPGKDHGGTLTIYARIPAGQWVPAGTYTDTIIVTLNF